MLSERGSKTAQVRLRWGESEEIGKQKSDARGRSSGHLWGHLIQTRPQGQQQESRPEAPKIRRGKTELGPFGPAWNSPSTVFFLKRDAMVRDLVRAARLGPVRPATGKGPEEKDRPLEGSGWRSGWAREEGGVSRQDPRRAGIHEPCRSGVALRSGDRELRHFLEKSLPGSACVICARACVLRRLKLQRCPHFSCCPLSRLQRPGVANHARLEVVAVRRRLQAVSGGF